mgnify:FL=1
MGVFRRAIEKARNFLKPKQKPVEVKPYIGAGHRGVAAGSLERRAREGFTQAEINKFKPISEDYASDFVYEGAVLFVHSTNVSASQYWINDKKMMVEYKNGSAYLYYNVSEQEAISFVRAMSKGGWGWTHLRVRGSKTRHRKPYVRIK